MCDSLKRQIETMKKEQVIFLLHKSEQQESHSVSGRSAI